MFVIKTFINPKNKPINNLELVNVMFQEYFVEVADNAVFMEIANDLDLNYINGAICIEYFGQKLMDFTLWDLVDQLWGYILNVIDDVLTKGSGSTFFPDQPISLEIVEMPSGMLMFNLHEGKKVKIVLPKKEFFLALLIAADEFFSCMTNYLQGKVDYTHELEKIKMLKFSLQKGL